MISDYPSPRDEGARLRTALDAEFPDAPIVIDCLTNINDLDKVFSRKFYQVVLFDDA